MKITLKNKLVKRFDFLHYNPDLKMYPYHMFGVECGDGWFKLLWDLFTKIEKILLKADEHFAPEFEVHQIKEKFAGLRVYCSGRIDAIHTLIDIAEEESFKICEDCGAKAQDERVDIHGWYSSLCRKCEKKERNAYNKRNKKTTKE